MRRSFSPSDGVNLATEFPDDELTNGDFDVILSEMDHELEV